MTPLSVFLQTKKSVFGVSQSVVISVSTSDPNVSPETFEGSKTGFGAESKRKRFDSLISSESRLWVKKLLEDETHSHAMQMGVIYLRSYGEC